MRAGDAPSFRQDFRMLGEAKEKSVARPRTVGYTETD